MGKAGQAEWKDQQCHPGGERAGHVATCMTLRGDGAQHPGTEAVPCSQAKIKFFLRAWRLLASLSLGETWTDLPFEKGTLDRMRIAQVLGSGWSKWSFPGQRQWWSELGQEC